MEPAVLKLFLPTSSKFVSVATSFIENGAIGFDMGKNEALALTLATEEVFNYISAIAAPDQHLELLCRNNIGRIEAEFIFESQNFNVSAFNITSHVDIHSHNFEETGLLIAARMIDRFRFFHEHNVTRLILAKNKAYPLAQENLPMEEPRLSDLRKMQPNDEYLKLMIRYAAQSYNNPFIPMWFQTPGYAIDLFRNGLLFGLIITDGIGHLGGGLLWRKDSDKLLEFFGPYVFDSSHKAEISHLLLEGFLESIAKTRAIGVINRYPTDAVSSEYFDNLGSLRFKATESDAKEITTYFRQIDEDPGLTVWSHELLLEFLEKKYEHLFFAREINLISNDGEQVSPNSVLASEVNIVSKKVTLKPIWMGRDVKQIIKDHISTFQNEGIHNIYFELDLGLAWQSYFVPALLESEFSPRIILPYAGIADIVVFQHCPGDLNN